MHSEKLRFWAFRLWEEFDLIKHSNPALKNIQPPGFDFSNNMTSKLGTWNPGLRRITLSTTLLEHGLLEEILEVFRHEVAHQLVNEYFNIKDPKPHGKAFKKACEIVNCSESALMKLKHQETKEELKLINKVEKLLALSQSPNKNEAKAALQKANNLSQKYNIDELNSHKKRDFSILPLLPVRKKNPRYMNVLTVILEKHYQCKCLYTVKRDNINGGAIRPVEVYATPENLKIAEFVYYYLLDEGNRIWEYFKLSNPYQKFNKNTFLYGLYAEFLETLEDDNELKEYGLIHCKDPLLDEFFYKHNPNVTKKTSRGKVDAKSFMSGKSQGKNLNIPNAIDNQGKKRRLLS